jgi:hypothetical protein
MSFLEPIILGDITFHDIRHPDKPYDMHDALRASKRVQRQMMDDKQVLLGGVDPGGKKIREDVAQRGFSDYKRAGGSQNFDDWRSSEEYGRTEDDCAGLTESTLWYAIRDGEPQGSIVMYCIELLSRSGAIVKFQAMCAPLTKNTSDASDFMVHALDELLPGVSDAGEELQFELMNWRFPNLDRVNRWDFDNGDGKALALGLSDRHELTIEERDGMRFPTFYTRRAP